jgi:hypothetical protein
MHSAFQVFTPPENPVLSLEVQAQMRSKEIVRMNRFVVLARHFFDRFFDNPMTSADGGNGIRVIQILVIIAVPSLLVTLSLMPSYFIFPPNTAPRGYWPRVCDHYFYVMYASIAMGAATVFEWDLLFPDLLDVLVLMPLPVPARKFFAAKIAALGFFLALFLLASGLPGAAFLPLIAEEPSVVRHILAHILAVTAGGLFTAALFVSLQGILINLFGEKVFRWISPILQALSLTLLLIVLFLFPLLSQNLQLLLTSGNQAALWFPIFWFLGVYQTVLEGSAAPHAFHILAAKGALALLIVLSLTIVTYPLAFRRKMRSTIEGTVAKSSRNWLAAAKDTVLHAIYILRPSQRAAYHFISQTLKRAPHHRVSLSMYGGVGLALLIATTLGLQRHDGKLHLVYSDFGLRSAIPVSAFLVVSGLKVAFMSPVELKANWPFHVIGARPSQDHVAATLRWTLPRAIFVTIAVFLVGKLLSPATFPGWPQRLVQLLLAQGLCLLLIDIFFLGFLSVPFTAPLAYSKRNLAMYVAALLALFVPFIQTTVDIGHWIERRATHFIIAALLILVAHLLLQRHQQRKIRERADWYEDVEIDEFPQRLGLS